MKWWSPVRGLGDKGSEAEDFKKLTVEEKCSPTPVH